MLQGFEYAKYEDLDSGLSVLGLNKEAAGNRVVYTADHAWDKDRNNWVLGHDRAHPAINSFEDYPSSYRR